VVRLDIVYLDKINEIYGMHTVSFAGAGIRKPWRMLTNQMSPRYTTSWNELAVVSDQPRMQMSIA